MRIWGDFWWRKNYNRPAMLSRHATSHLFGVLAYENMACRQRNFCSLLAHESDRKKARLHIERAMWFFSMTAISLGVFSKKTPGAKIKQPRQRGGFCQLSPG